MTEMTQPMSVGGVSCTHVFKNQAHRNREQNGGCQGLGDGGNGERLVKWYKFSVTRGISSEDLKYSIVNGTVLYT